MCHFGRDALSTLLLVMGGLLAVTFGLRACPNGADRRWKEGAYGSSIRHGGGRPHRRDLEDGLLVKTNHLAIVPLEEAVRRLRRRRHRGERVEVEVRTVGEALRAARGGADALLLDNRTPAEARRIVRALAGAGLRRGTWVELSGGITPANVARFRRAGADAASLGSVTHSAPALPFHLVVHPAVLKRRPA